MITKLTSLCGGIVSKIKQKMFEVFGRSLEYIDSDASPRTITAWKESDNTKWCFENLGVIMPDGSNTTYMNEIIRRSFQSKTATENDRLFAIAIVCYLLDTNSSGIKIEKKSILKRMDQLWVCLFSINILLFHCFIYFQHNYN